MNERDRCRSKGPELLNDLADKVSVALVELIELDKPLAEHVGLEVANRMATHWGGQLVYFPIGTAMKLSARDVSIWNDFNGNNHSDLARKYGVSLQWIYKIVKTMRAEDTARRQSALFPIE
ncbi:MAG: rdgB [Burkholderiaceae bacterium]|nr:rdgB [Burkholderiaceae bacterium]